jgi:pilus assembly protein Flp/PilA
LPEKRGAFAFYSRAVVRWHFRAIGGVGLGYYNFVADQPWKAVGRVRVSGGTPVGLGGTVIINVRKRSPVAKRLQQLWNDERGQDIAEYAVMLAVILVIVVGTIRLIGSNANSVFSQVGSAIQ